MDPNREYVDGETSAEVDTVGDFRTWLNSPPRQRKRDVVAVLAGAGLLSGTVIVGVEGDTGTVLLGSLAATLATQLAEVLPLGAVNSARVLRVAGLLGYVAMIVWILALGFGN